MKASPLSKLQRYHRFVVWTPALWTLAAGLAVDGLLVALGAEPRYRLWSSAVFVCMALASRICARPRLDMTARGLDAKLRSQNRLEAVAQLGSRSDAMATAVLSEAGEFLARRRLPPPYTALAGTVAVTALVIRLLTMPAPAMNHAPAAAAPTRSAAANESAAVAKQPEIPLPPPAAPFAELRWLRPDADAEAHPAENVPLRAESESGTGLSPVVLAMYVNGVPKPPLEVSPSIATSIQALETALPLDALGAKATDVITYHLSAERTRPADTPKGPPWPPVVSPLQILRVISDGEPFLGGSVDDELERQLVEARQLRRDAVEIVRAAFALGHELPPRADPLWKDLLENSLRTTESVRDRAAGLARASIPAEERAALERASSANAGAARLLREENPAESLASATRALVDVVSVECAVQARADAARRRLAAEEAARALNLASGAGITLPLRELTPAGRLEKLAIEQSALADTLASRQPAPDLFQKQDRLSRDLVQLASVKAFPTEITELVASASVSAKEAAAQLNEQDPIAATEPATRAAQTLADAVAKLEAVSRMRIGAELLVAQRTLVHEAVEILFSPDELAMTEALRQVRAVHDALAASALREQERGSAEVARALAGYAETLDAGDAADTETRGARRERLMRLGQEAANLNRALNASEDDLKKATDELARAKAQLENKSTAATEKKLHEDAEVAMQKVRAITMPESASQDADQKRRAEKAHRQPPAKPTTKERDEAAPGKPGLNESASKERDDEQKKSRKKSDPPEHDDESPPGASDKQKQGSLARSDSQKKPIPGDNVLPGGKASAAGAPGGAGA